MNKKDFFIHIIIYTLILRSTNCYLFSVIMCIYNSEKYLDDSINSLINQTIGFEKIQLILVNDGSIDNSERICLKYKNIYPNNIIYIKIKNSGPSRARNIGLSYAKGKYINFLDSDDKWDKNSFNYAFLFFKIHKKIDIIGGRIKYFESTNNFHFLDYKFLKTRIVNLDKEYNCIQLHASSSFFRYTSISKYKFDEHLKYGEDVKLISNILLIKPEFGILREAIYYYRKRADSSSALQNSYKHIYYYFDVLYEIHLFLIKESKKLYNKIIPFIQFYIAYEFLFRVGGKANIYLDKKNYKKYCDLYRYIIEQIDEKYILEQKIFSFNVKLMALTIKNSRDIRYDLIIKNGHLIYSDYKLIDIKNYNKIIIWKILEIDSNKLHLKGEERFWLPTNNYFYYCRIGNNIFYPQYHYIKDLDFASLYGIIYKGRIISFDITLEIKEKEKLCFYIDYQNSIIEIFTSISSIIQLPTINKSYYSFQNFIIRNENNNLFIYIYKPILEKMFENDYIQELKRINKYELIKIRRNYFKKKGKNNFKDKYQTWLINDKENQAGDNGEYFFRYLVKKHPKELLVYFIIEKNCSDYRRLKKYGNIVELKSEKHLTLFLNSNKIVTSVSEDWVNNPFEKNGKYLRDLYHFDYIYLKSDILRNEFSRNTEIIKWNFNMIIIPSKKQYNSLINIGYENIIKNIILTGFTRFDNLKRIKSQIKVKKIILIYLTEGINQKEDINNMNTNYLKFYFNLTNEKNLLYSMEQNDYKGILCLNQKFNHKIFDYSRNKLFQIKKICNNQELFAKASLLITDYSNIFLDFGYLNKPIIYSQIDYKEYKSAHFLDGYFNYDKEGFGPVCYNLKCIISNVISIIENKNIFGKKYFRRIKRFYKYSLEKNCEETFLEIKRNSNKRDSIKKYVYIRIHNIIINFIIYFLFIIKFYKYIELY